MVVIRNRIASLGAGGPRQFAEIRNKLIISSEPTQKGVARSELDSLGFRSRQLRNAPVLIAEPEGAIEDIIDRLQENIDGASQAIEDIQDAREEEEGVIESTAATIRATQGLVEQINQLSPIRTSNFAHSFSDFGPANLRLDPEELRDVLDAEEEGGTLQETVDSLNIPEAWRVDRGENSIIAIFDTGFSRDLINSSRVVGTFSSDEVDSVFAPSEGHGTMCAGAAAANSDEGVPFDGVAPDAKVMLVRITGEGGQIRSDIVADAWDWLMSNAGNTPIVTNHSYGVPLCSTLRRPQFCNDSLSEVITIANSDKNITSCYAAGNEAMYCGHRLSGLTNGVTSHNSLEEVISVGALLTNGQEAQRYSSHGRGDCAPRADPKPNVSCRIPTKTYYGTEGGWEIKDMSTGVLGSGGGTSHASPMITGMLALLQSAADEPLQTEEIKQVIKEHSVAPRPTQINQFGFLAGPSGWDARFGFGQLDITSAIQSI